MFDNRTLTELDKKLLKEKFPNTYEEKIKEIEEGYPIQYLLGNVVFLNVDINVNPYVLIPRFETEYLVEKVLKKIDSFKEKKLQFIDICTGSGCIAIAIAKNTNFDCTGIDISKEALKIANENASKNNVKIQWKTLNILEEELKQNYDIIISNPPYIDRKDTVDRSTMFEPSIALYAEDNGLLFYKKILKRIKNNPKLIAFEIGENQNESLLNLCNQRFPNAQITCEEDLCKKKRYIFIEH